MGHHIDKCTSFKHKVTTLLKHGWIVLDDDNIRPNIKNNALPTHKSEGSVNDLKKEEEKPKEILNMGKLEVPMKDLLGMLKEIEYVKLELQII